MTLLAWLSVCIIWSTVWLLVLGAVVLNERRTSRIAAGGVLVLASVALVMRRETTGS